MNELPNLPKNVSQVSSPNHPFTFEGPDTLIYNSSGLLALFTPKENELTNYLSFFSRITNSIIAYPPKTKILIVVDPRQKISNIINQYGKWYASDLIELKDLKYSNALIIDKKEDRRISDLKKAQKIIFNNQAKFQLDNSNYVSQNKFEKNISNISITIPKAGYIDNLTKKNITARANIFELNDNCYGIKRLTNKVADLIDLKPFFEFALKAEYNIDNGVPYQTHQMGKVLNVDSIPKNKFDPLKPIRLVSLFGWHIVNTDSLEGMENRITKL